MKVVYSEIFTMLGMSLKFEILPPIRLAIRLKTGDIDAELVRMSTYGDTHPELTRVEEPILNLNVFAYSTSSMDVLKPSKTIKSIIGYTKGVRVVENELINKISKKNLKQFSNMKQAIGQLSVGRINYFVSVEKVFDEQINKYQLEIKKKIYKLNKLKSDSAHMFLGPKFAHLAKTIAAKLKNMKSTG
jgi:hypothetical protein